MEENFKKQEIMNVVEKECEAIAKFIKEKVKLRPTLVMYKVPLGKGKKMSICQLITASEKMSTSLCFPTKRKFWHLEKSLTSTLISTG